MKIRDRLNALANRFYIELGNVDRPDFDFSAATHPTERLCYRLAEAAWEALTGDRPDYALDDDDDDDLDDDNLDDLVLSQLEGEG